MVTHQLKDASHQVNTKLFNFLSNPFVYSLRILWLCFPVSVNIIVPSIHGQVYSTLFTSLQTETTHIP